MTFAGMWCEADDYGRGVADPRILKGAIWPLDDELGWQDVEKHLGELEETGHIRRYDVGGHDFFEITSWAEHQSSAYRRGKAIFPSANGTILHDEECKDLQDARPVVLEGKGREGNEEGKPSRTTSKRRSSRTEIPDKFMVTDEMARWVDIRCPELDWRLHTEKFVNYWKGEKGLKSDWERTWRNWMLSEYDKVPAWVKKQAQVKR